MTRTLVVWSIVGCLGFSAYAQEAKPLPDAAAGEIAELIDQLEGAEFAERQEATRKLSEVGRAVIPQLEKVAAGSSREASVRAFDVIGGHFQRGDNETKASAKAVLDRLAASTNPAIAQRAQNILNPPPVPTAAEVAALAGVPRLANLQVQMAAIPGAARSVTVSRDANGGIRIQLRENAKTTKIESLPGGKITAEITEKQNGQEVTKKIEAADVGELKKKDAEIARIFEQYNQPARIGFAPLRPAAPLPVGGFGRPAPIQPADTLKRRIESLDGQIKRLKEGAPQTIATKGMLDELQTMRARYQRQLEEIEKPAQPAPGNAPQPAEAEKGVGGQ